ncbi:MAG: S-adenosylmethionine:tRNA ribosyltransferase-isomerase [Myxococcales bacterium]|nr:S-adenosylmethionine:tRNA ribosyltransferase-isomerase [Myxococcales bacterium]
MQAATTPRDPRDLVRLLIVDRRGCRDAGVAGELPHHLRRGDLLVVNDAATLPASLPASLGNAALELRLAQPPRGDRAQAVLFGAGDWRTRTEHRPAPPLVAPGEGLRVAEMEATVLSVDALSPRLLLLRFDRGGDALLAAIYRHGRVVQYAHLADEVPLWSAQTIFAARPWAVEAPSAGRPISGATLAALRARGVRLATLTHAAGLSATGDPRLDAALPLPERYDIPEATAAAVREALAAGRRVVAVGTTVVRALEDSAERHGTVRAGEAIAGLRVDASYRPRVVSAVLTGMHAPGESHYDLLAAFAPVARLTAAHRHAAEAGYLAHEFGDLALVEGRPILRSRAARNAPRSRGIVWS